MFVRFLVSVCMSVWLPASRLESLIYFLLKNRKVESVCATSKGLCVSGGRWDTTTTMSRRRQTCQTQRPWKADSIRWRGWGWVGKGSGFVDRRIKRKNWWTINMVASLVEHQLSTMTHHAALAGRTMTWLAQWPLVWHHQTAKMKLQRPVMSSNPHYRKKGHKSSTEPLSAKTVKTVCCQFESRLFQTFIFMLSRVAERSTLVSSLSSEWNGIQAIK